MSIDNEIIPLDDELDMQSNEASSLDRIQETMEVFLSAADAQAVYAEPLVQGDTLIVPAAEIVSVMGFGLGDGYGGADETSAAGGGSGGGGGGRIFSRPVAVIVASPSGVEVKPVIDLTKITLAALTTGAFMLGMLWRLSRSMDEFKEDLWE